jgi:integrase
VSSLRWFELRWVRGERAGMALPIHPHMLRHGCGFKLANDGHDTRALQHYLGHKNIQHTVRYTELSPNRFKDFWRRSRPANTSTTPVLAGLVALILKPFHPRLHK